ncbi:MAG TPA: ribosome maturation factor RimP [Acidimicrobiales bacterium]|nr:ribosome maturation factor RimP [Acidimicrobiales bacterium]
MAMTTATRVEHLVTPLLEAAGLELYDLELAGGVLRVLVDRDGGADIDALSEVARQLSRALDEHDPIAGRYTLEVSTPGLERPLRTAAHFRGALGTEVKVRTMPHVEGERRVDGTVTAADDDAVTVTGADGTVRALRYDEIERARTVFAWGPAEHKPKRSKRT